MWFNVPGQQLEWKIPVPAPWETHESMEEYDFQRELEGLLNKYSQENKSDTPDFLLAQFLIGCLHAFNTVTKRRQQWYGGHHVSDPINASEFPDYDILNHRWIPQSEWTPEISQAVAKRQDRPVSNE